MTISERIFVLIKERGFTQKEFSKRTGIAESTISDWKKKGTNPVSDKILVICKVLEVSPYFLLSGSEDPDAVKKPVKTVAKPKTKPVKKEAAPATSLPEIATIAKDDDDYHIRDIKAGSGKDETVKEKVKDKKKDKKKDKDKDALKEKKKDKKKDKGKDKDKKKKKKGYLITY